MLEGAGAAAELATVFVVLVKLACVVAVPEPRVRPGAVA